MYPREQVMQLSGGRFQDRGHDCLTEITGLRRGYLFTIPARQIAGATRRYNKSRFVVTTEGEIWQGPQSYPQVAVLVQDL